VAALAATRVRRLEVVGPSMLPTLAPGERVLAVRGARRVRPDDLVVVPDPRLPTRLVVKRVVELSGRTVTVQGDNRGASTDSRTFGPVPAGSVQGRVVYRYHPRSRRGPVP
jgi:nickel-type superoxide dismutase maturation protease